MSSCDQCGDDAPLCPDCQMCRSCCDCEDLFDADELGLDPEEDEDRRYARPN